MMRIECTYQDTVLGHCLYDDLSLQYDGNQLRKVTDQCGDLTYAGAMDFKDGANKTVEYTWDANGNMTSDPTRTRRFVTIFEKTKKN